MFSNGLIRAAAAAADDDDDDDDDDKTHLANKYLAKTSTIF